MNRLYTIFLTLLTAIFLTGCYNSEDREKVLKIYNWGDYIDEEVLAAFPCLLYTSPSPRDCS